jgi:hypothetical protein
MTNPDTNPDEYGDDAHEYGDDVHEYGDDVHEYGDDAHEYGDDVGYDVGDDRGDDGEDDEYQDDATSVQPTEVTYIDPNAVSSAVANITKGISLSMVDGQGDTALTTAGLSISIVRARASMVGYMHSVDAYVIYISPTLHSTQIVHRTQYTSYIVQIVHFS